MEGYIVKIITWLFVIAGLIALMNAIYVITFKYNLASANLSAPQMTQYYSESMASGIIAIGLISFGMAFLALRPMPRLSVMPTPSKH